MSRTDSAGVLAGRWSAGRRRALDTVTSLPAWAAVLLVWTGGRVLSTLWLALAYPLIGRALPDNAIWGNEHGFGAFLVAWDGQYYEQISLHGYPDALPLDAAGNVAQNAWAFLPAFPFTIRALTASTGVPFDLGAPLVAIVAGLLATFLLHRLVRDRAGHAAAMWAVFFFSCGPLSFLLQVGYAESMFLVLSFGALLALERRRYALLTALGVAAAFTRPGALAIPLVLGVVALVRWVRARRETGRVFERFPLREQVGVVAAGLTMVAAGLAWPVIASHVTGTPNAYLETEMSWWVNFIGRVDFVPLTPWFLIAGPLARRGRDPDRGVPARRVPDLAAPEVDAPARTHDGAVLGRVRAVRLRGVVADGLDPAAAHAARAAVRVARAGREALDAVDARVRGVGGAAGAGRGALVARPAVSS
ncbi:hypothetical protein Q9Q99_07370 [Curtobacterium flaccumfaciens]|nr:hypothetical protein Q9Q99_07370 [Curtobacterium flaccumfaciens]